MDLTIDQLMGMQSNVIPGYSADDRTYRIQNPLTNSTEYAYSGTYTPKINPVGNPGMDASGYYDSISGKPLAYDPDTGQYNWLNAGGEGVTSLSQQLYLPKSIYEQLQSNPDMIPGLSLGANRPMEGMAPEGFRLENFVIPALTSAFLGGALIPGAGIGNMISSGFPSFATFLGAEMPTANLGFGGDMFPLTSEGPIFGGTGFGGDMFPLTTEMGGGMAGGGFASTDPMEILKRLLTPQSIGKTMAGGPLGGGPISNLLGIASGLRGLLGASKLAGLSGDAAQPRIVDSFGAGARNPYYQQLLQLAQNPDVTKIPGYEAGLQAVQRTMAGQGYLGSGNMMTALADYGGKFYNDEMARLMQLSGANFAPAISTGNPGAAIQGYGNSMDLTSKALASLGFVSRALNL